MLTLIECFGSLDLLYPLLDCTSLKNFLIAIHCGRKTDHDVYDSELWRRRLKSDLLIDLTDLTDRLPNSDYGIFRQALQRQNTSLQFEALNGCIEMRIYVTITTFLQCCVYFVKNDMAISYLVNDMSVDIVVIPCSVLEYVKRRRDEVILTYSGAELRVYFRKLKAQRRLHENSLLLPKDCLVSPSPIRAKSAYYLAPLLFQLNSIQSQTYSYQAEKRVYRIHARILEAIWGVTRFHCPILVFMFTGVNDFKDDIMGDKAQVLAMKALWRLMERQNWSTNVVALSANKKTRTLFQKQDRKMICETFLSEIFPYPGIFL